MAQYEHIDGEFAWNVKIGFEDDLEVISRAVRKYLERKSGKLIIGKQDLCRMLGEIIEDGFLQDAKDLREKFIEINNERIKKQESEDVGLQTLIYSRRKEILELKEQKESLLNALHEIEDAIKQHDGDVIEPDPALASAKRAYKFIYDETRDEVKAAKAFNSYLLRGINQGTVDAVNAEEIIKIAKEDGNKYFWMNDDDDKPNHPRRRR